MKKLLAVGLLALGSLGLLMMRNTRSAVAAPQAQNRELAPLQLIQKIPIRTRQPFAEISGSIAFSPLWFLSRKLSPIFVCQFKGSLQKIAHSNV